ncbi:hypothetical protein KEF85_16160 [Methylomonas paludis]|uniref:Uncharacterized protein n=1 Tax=Methylomonas paludis TaxID=1173101 RepID=A0A975MNW9_9GAMM|nr:hypothetical protein [Methylomonas paludis]QWF70826.1 hypothetical protein KEF85_16160 [Methylomonas paludis]
MEAFFASFGIVGVLFFFLLVLLWTLLPFAVFGIKDRLDQQIALLEKIEQSLAQQNQLRHSPRHLDGE